MNLEYVVKNNFLMEMPGIEPGAFHMQSERATTALHPLPLMKFAEFSELIRESCHSSGIIPFSENVSYECCHALELLSFCVVPYVAKCCAV